MIIVLMGINISPININTDMPSTDQGTASMTYGISNNCAMIWLPIYHSYGIPTNPAFDLATNSLFKRLIICVAKSETEKAVGLIFLLPCASAHGEYSFKPIFREDIQSSRKIGLKAFVLSVCSHTRLQVCRADGSFKHHYKDLAAIKIGNSCLSTFEQPTLWDS